MSDKEFINPLVDQPPTLEQPLEVPQAAENPGFAVYESNKDLALKQANQDFVKGFTAQAYESSIGKTVRSFTEKKSGSTPAARKYTSDKEVFDYYSKEFGINLALDEVRTIREASRKSMQDEDFAFNSLIRSKQAQNDIRENPTGAKTALASEIAARIGLSVTAGSAGAKLLGSTALRAGATAGQVRAAAGLGSVVADVGLEAGIESGVAKTENREFDASNVINGYTPFAILGGVADGAQFVNDAAKRLERSATIAKGTGIVRFIEADETDGIIAIARIQIQRHVDDEPVEVIVKENGAVLRALAGDRDALKQVVGLDSRITNEAQAEAVIANLRRSYVDEAFNEVADKAFKSEDLFEKAVDAVAGVKTAVPASTAQVETAARFVENLKVGETSVKASFNDAVVLDLMTYAKRTKAEGPLGRLLKNEIFDGVDLTKAEKKALVQESALTARKLAEEQAAAVAARNGGDFVLDERAIKNFFEDSINRKILELKQASKSKIIEKAKTKAATVAKNTLDAKQTKQVAKRSRDIAYTVKRFGAEKLIKYENGIAKLGVKDYASTIGLRTFKEQFGSEELARIADISNSSQRITEAAKLLGLATPGQKMLDEFLAGADNATLRAIEDALQSAALKSNLDDFLDSLGDIELRALVKADQGDATWIRSLVDGLEVDESVIKALEGQDALKIANEVEELVTTRIKKGLVGAGLLVGSTGAFAADDDELNNTVNATGILAGLLLSAGLLLGNKSVINATRAGAAKIARVASPITQSHNEYLRKINRFTKTAGKGLGSLSKQIVAFGAQVGTHKNDLYRAAMGQLMHDPASQSLNRLAGRGENETSFTADVYVKEKQANTGKVLQAVQDSLRVVYMKEKGFNTLDAAQARIAHNRDLMIEGQKLVDAQDKQAVINAMPVWAKDYFIERQKMYDIELKEFKGIAAQFDSVVLKERGMLYKSDTRAQFENFEFNNGEFAVNFNATKILNLVEEFGREYMAQALSPYFSDKTSKFLDVMTEAAGRQDYINTFNNEDLIKALSKAGIDIRKDTLKELLNTNKLDFNSTFKTPDGADMKVADLLDANPSSADSKVMAALNGEKAMMLASLDLHRKSGMLLDYTNENEFVRFLTQDVQDFAKEADDADAFVKQSDIEIAKSAYKELRGQSRSVLSSESGVIIRALMSSTTAILGTGFTFGMAGDAAGVASLKGLKTLQGNAKNLAYTGKVDPETIEAIRYMNANFGTGEALLATNWTDIDAVGNASVGYTGLVNGIINKSLKSSGFIALDTTARNSVALTFIQDMLRFADDSADSTIVKVFNSNGFNDETFIKEAAKAWKKYTDENGLMTPDAEVRFRTEDPVQYSNFVTMRRRTVSRRSAEKAGLGANAKFLDGVPQVKPFLQLLNSALNITYRSVGDMTYFNQRTAAIFIKSMVGAGLGYIARQYFINGLDEQKLNNNLQPEEVLKAAIRNSAFAGLMPNLVGSIFEFLGYENYFEAQQVRAFDSSLLAVPASGFLDNVTNIPKAALNIITGEAVQKDYLTFKAVMPTIYLQALTHHLLNYYDVPKKRDIDEDQ